MKKLLNNEILVKSEIKMKTQRCKLLNHETKHFICVLKCFWYTHLALAFE